jgi:hypothetical protein
MTMKRFWTASVICFLLLLPSIFAGIGEAQWSEPEKVNKLVTGVVAPVFEPGAPADISFVFSNPFNSTMFDIEVVAEPYLLSYEDGSSDWSGLTDPPRMVNSTTNSSTISIDSLAPQSNQTLEWPIITTGSTSRGGMFSQSVYFVRVSISFDSNGQHVRYASKGFFNESQWNRLTKGGDQQSPMSINSTYLSELGYSGIIPDMSFIVRDVIPVWPVAVILVMASVTGLTALYYYLKSNPMNSFRSYFVLMKIRNTLKGLNPVRRKRAK